VGSNAERATVSRGQLSSFTMGVGGSSATASGMVWQSKKKQVGAKRWERTVETAGTGVK
jgi:hypothetical protein